MVQIFAHQKRAIRKRWPLFTVSKLALIALALFALASSDAMLMSLLATVLIGLALSLVFSGMIYVFLLVKNRSVFHSAMTDPDPIVLLGVRILCGMLFVVYCVLLYFLL